MKTTRKPTRENSLIDGIGMQGHYSVNTNPANIELSLKRFIESGVEVSITELDVRAEAISSCPKKKPVPRVTSMPNCLSFSVIMPIISHVLRSGNG